MDDGTQDLREKLASYLRERKAVSSPAVMEAFRRVPRHLFVPGYRLDQVYSDIAIVTRRRGTIPISASSQPAIMAIMLEQLDVQPGQRVLEVGAGTGYNAALLAELVHPHGQVVTIDIAPSVAEEARQHLEEAGYPQVTVVSGDGGLGWPETAPFDRIVVTAGCANVPLSWFEQLDPGGVLVLPLRINTHHFCIVLDRQPWGFLSRSLGPCGFMELKGRYRQPGQGVLGRARDLVVQHDYRGPRLSPHKLLELLLTIPLRETVRGLKEALVGSEEQGTLLGAFSSYLALQLDPLVAINPMSQGYGLPSFVRGLVDTKAEGACLWSQESLKEDQVLVYGSAVMLERLRQRFREWEALGKPDLGRLTLALTPRRRGARYPSLAGTVVTRRRLRSWLLTAAYQ